MDTWRNGELAALSGVGKNLLGVQARHVRLQLDTRMGIWQYDDFSSSEVHCPAK